MKVILNLKELKKGDTVIIKHAKEFDERGLMRITGDVFELESKDPHTFTIKCLETKEIEKIFFSQVKVYLVDGGY